MAIRTNMQSLQPRKQQFRREIILLSKGYNNPSAWPGGLITVYPWDSEVDAFFLDNARKLPRNRLLCSLLEKLCNLNGGSAEEFVADEIGTIMLVAKSIMTDMMVDYTATCPSCNRAEKAKIKVPDELVKVGEKQADYPGWDDITLPVCQDVVRIRPLLMRDELAIVERTETERSTIPDSIMRSLRRIVAVNGGAPDRLEEVYHYYSALPPKDVKEFEDKARELSPHLDSTIWHVCNECQTKFPHPLAFDIEFFRR